MKIYNKKRLPHFCIVSSAFIYISTRPNFPSPSLGMRINLLLLKGPAYSKGIYTGRINGGLFAVRYTLKLTLQAV